MFVLCIFDGTEGQRIVPVYPLRNFFQEFGLSPAKPADGSDEPGTFFGRKVRDYDTFNHAIYSSSEIFPALRSFRFSLDTLLQA